jgi:hypothetical protein
VCWIEYDQSFCSISVATDFRNEPLQLSSCSGRATCRTVVVRFPSDARHAFWSPKRLARIWHPRSYPFNEHGGGGGYSLRLSRQDVKLTTHLHFVQQYECPELKPQTSDCHPGTHRINLIQTSAHAYTHVQAKASLSYWKASAPTNGRVTSRVFFGTYLTQQ